ncbi:MAG: hypothetical protein HYY13_13100 [Nitrospirae bacterium]|nr:hypothetical protein [Nitrospirota bacterium]
MKQDSDSGLAHVVNPRIEVSWFEVGAKDVMSRVEPPTAVKPDEIVKFTSSEGELTEVIAKNGKALFNIDLKLRSADPKGSGGADIVWIGPDHRKWLCELKAGWVTAPVVGQAVGYLFEHMPRDGKKPSHYQILAGGFRVNHQACGLADLLTSSGLSIVIFELAERKREKDGERLLRLRVFRFDGKGIRANFKPGMVLYDAINVNWAGHTGYLEIQNIGPRGECGVQMVKEEKGSEGSPGAFKPAHEIKMASTLVHLEVVPRSSKTGGNEPKEGG